MDLKSFSHEELRQATSRGEELWLLDTGSAGEDDVLIGTEEECLAAILHHHELEELPRGWTLEKVTLDEIY